MKFTTKPIRYHQPHLRHVATLPCKIKNLNFLQIFSRYGRKCKTNVELAYISYSISGDHNQYVAL